MTLPTDWRVEVLDSEGILATAQPEHGHYAIRHRNGRAVACRTRVEITLSLLRMALGTDEPAADVTTIAAGMESPRCARCGEPIIYRDAAPPPFWEHVTPPDRPHAATAGRVAS